MLARLALFLVLAGALPAHAGNVPPIKGNDTGGIIAWSPEAERMAPAIAGNNCAAWGKYARLRSIRRMYGDYIAYECIFPRHHGRYVAVRAYGQADAVPAWGRTPAWSR